MRRRQHEPLLGDSGAAAGLMLQRAAVRGNFQTRGAARRVVARTRRGVPCKRLARREDRRHEHDLQHEFDELDCHDSALGAVHMPETSPHLACFRRVQGPR